MSENYSEVRDIIQKLYDEFLSEEKKLNDICNSRSVDIDKLDHKISNYRKNDDVDFKVFSPRNVSSVNTDKILELEKEKETLESESKNSSKQLKYYRDKVEKLERVLYLLNSTNVNNSSNTFIDVDSLTDYKEESNKDDSLFNELFPSRTKEPENPIESIINEAASVDNDIEKDTSTDNKVQENVIDDNYITPGSIAHIVHKAEFTEKIISNDTIRAKIELKEIIRLLKDLLIK